MPFSTPGPRVGFQLQPGNPRLHVNEDDIEMTDSCPGVFVSVTPSLYKV